MMIQKIKSFLPHAEIELLGQKFKVRKKYAQKLNQSLSSLLVLSKLKSFNFITTPDIKKHMYDKIEDRLKYGFGIHVKFFKEKEESNSKNSINNNLINNLSSTISSSLGTDYAFEITISLDKNFKFKEFLCKFGDDFKRNNVLIIEKFAENMINRNDDYERRSGIIYGTYKTSHPKEAIHLIDVLQKIL